MQPESTIKTFAEIGKQLGFYVYLLVHPDTHKIFYVGKGENDRVFSHVNDVSKKLKNNETLSSDNEKTIADILRQGKDPLMYIVRYNLDESEAFLLESALIELLNRGLFNLPQQKSGGVGFGQLTNIQGGHSLDKGAISTVDELCTKMGTVGITLDDKGRAVITGHSPINLLVAKLPSYIGVITNQKQREDRTRGDWPLSRVRIDSLLNKGKLYIASAEDGIITAVYEINEVENWFSVKQDNGKYKRRVRFKVTLLNSTSPISQELIGKNVFFNKSQFPIIYCCV